MIKFSVRDSTVTRTDVGGDFGGDKRLVNRKGEWQNTERWREIHIAVS